MQVQTQSVTYEQVAAVLQALPPAKLPSAYDYLRFLERQAVEEREWPFDATPEEMEADDREWDRLFATAASQRFLERMAAQALAEDEAGKTISLDDFLAQEEATDAANVITQQT